MVGSLSAVSQHCSLLLTHFRAQLPGLGWRLKEVFDGESYMDHPLNVVFAFWNRSSWLYEMVPGLPSVTTAIPFPIVCYPLAGVAIKYPQLEGDPQGSLSPL